MEFKPKTEAVTLEEGGEWIAFDDVQANGVPWNAKGRLVHAIRFEDASEWDPLNGWRDGGLPQEAQDFDAALSIYKSEDGDFNLDVYDRLGDDPDMCLLSIKVDAGQLDLLAGLFKLIQSQADGSMVSIKTKATKFA